MKIIGEITVSGAPKLYDNKYKEQFFIFRSRVYRLLFAQRSAKFVPMSLFLKKPIPENLLISKNSQGNFLLKLVN